MYRNSIFDKLSPSFGDDINVTFISSQPVLLILNNFIYFTNFTIFSNILSVRISYLAQTYNCSGQT